MKTILIEGNWVQPNNTVDQVQRYIQKVIRENDSQIQSSPAGKRLTISLKGKPIAIIEVRP